MRVIVACKRGNVAARGENGHCLCADCKAFRYRPKPGRAAYKAEWAKQNKDKCSAYSKKWIAANKEQRKSIVKAWRDRNPEKVAAINAKAGRKWAANNKGQRNASVRARVMAIRNRMPSWANRKEIAAFYAEAQRMTVATGVPHEVDHIIPLQGQFVSGLHVPENLRVIPRSINRSKRNKVDLSI